MQFLINRFTNFVLYVEIRHYLFTNEFFTDIKYVIIRSI